MSFSEVVEMLRRECKSEKHFAECMVRLTLFSRKKIGAPPLDDVGISALSSAIYLTTKTWQESEKHVGE